MEIIQMESRWYCNCGAEHEAVTLQKARRLFNENEEQYDLEYDTLYSELAINNAYEEFWNLVRAYIDESIKAMN